MGPVSTKLQATRDAPLEAILNLMCGDELDDLRNKYMRLKIEEKELFMNVLSSDDAYDILETNQSAKEFVTTLTGEQKLELVDKVFSFMEEHTIDMNDPIVDSPSRIRER